MLILEKRKSLISKLKFIPQEKKSKITWKQAEWRKLKFRAEINEIENRKTVEKTNKTEVWIHKKINKIDKPPARNFTNIRNEVRLSLKILQQLKGL